MAAIDLKGIHFRTYLPQYDGDINDGDYNPRGPGQTSRTTGAIDLGIIKIRAWEENNLNLQE